MQYKTLSNLFNSAPSLSTFATKLADLEQISQLVAANLEPSLRSQCRVANLRDGTLILSTTSPAWNHKLRFVALDLLSILRSQPAWRGLKAIEVRVDYLPCYGHDTTTNLQQPLSISAYNAKLIEETANNVTCKMLANSLQRLAFKGLKKSTT